jgi:hypothetical protein
MFLPLVKISVGNTLGDLVLYYGWVVFLWYRINFLCHFFFSLVSATSSYADDIAHTENRRLGRLSVMSHRVSVSFSFSYGVTVSLLI